MKNLKIIFALLLSTVFFFACKDKSNATDKETILTGSTTILVDETILPIIQEEVEVFQNQYNAKINLIGSSETEIAKLMSENKYQIAILSRELSKSEEAVFSKIKIKPRITPLAKDAVAFITNSKSKDSLIDLQQIIDFSKGISSTEIKGLVFDNANSSSSREVKFLAKVTSFPKNTTFSFKTNQEVIDFISNNPGMIGVVGVNWLVNSEENRKEDSSKIKVLSLKDLDSKNYYKPSQENIATGNYPLARTIKLLNYQNFSGLGMGFASFVAGETGQRIILKSGLVPLIMPSRNIVIRKEILKK